MPAPTPDVEGFSLEDEWMRAEVEGGAVNVEWAPQADGEVRYSTKGFVEDIDEGALACGGSGDCDFEAPDGAERLYLTLFREGEKEIQADEDMNAVLLELSDEGEGTTEGQGDGEGDGGGSDGLEVPPTTPPDEEEPGTPQEETPEPEPEPAPTPTEGESPAA